MFFNCLSERFPVSRQRSGHPHTHKNTYIHVTDRSTRVFGCRDRYLGLFLDFIPFFQFNLFDEPLEEVNVIFHQKKKKREKRRRSKRNIQKFVIIIIIIIVQMNFKFDFNFFFPCA